ncbi:type II toxin-antitoxin system CcdA family antitoxin [Hongsoonwoonella zoysiae]|uniref:type II toxin-antitoxin system CcdA family antitoxin n=1 Tax=Hongsoonwoonella zoysiae TaxID=2821844 RepID=UPI001AEF1289|nr:type II toxin-antitoxin system CcdA family antitoxin [Hongsoonwoonella zoysiae]
MKRSANLSVESELLEEAKALGINLSRTFEEALAARLQEARAEKWREENRGAIEAYNSAIDEAGTFAERMRRDR